VSKPTPRPNVPDTVTDSRDQLERDIDSAREQLGDTVEALAHKVNVPARAKDSVRDTVATVQTKASELTDDVGVAAARAVAALPPQARGRANRLVATIRQRPVPAALVAAGTLLFVVRLFRGNR
jgi:hypothetical protein